MKKVILTIATAIISSVAFAQENFKAPQTQEELGLLVEQMMKNIRAVKTAKFNFIKNERIMGQKEIVKSEQVVKLNTSPRKVYLKILKGHRSGTELLLVDGVNGNKALVSAGKYVPTVSLGVRSPMVTELQRHTLDELGFKYTGDLIYDAYVRYKHKAAEYAKYEGFIDFDGRKCHKIKLDNPEYKLTDYTVQEGDNLIKIARKNKLDEYSLLEYNPSVKGYMDIKPGQVIKIPPSFSKSVVMYVDVKTLLPVYQKVYDLIGLMAEYEYRNLQVNVPIADEEFTKDFKEYGF
jgi:LysM repeat protein